MGVSHPAPLTHLSPAMTKPCPFCYFASERILFENHHAVAFEDAHPVSPGHALAIPRRHAGSWFDLSGEERLAILDLMDKLHARAVESRHPAAACDGCCRARPPTGRRSDQLPSKTFTHVVALPESQGPAAHCSK